MRKLYSILTLLLFGLAVIAQPTITQNNMPQIGDQPPVVYCTDVPVESTLDGQSGANFSWDYSGLTTESNQGFDFVSPSATLWASSFPGADICGVDDATDAHAYYTSTNSAFSNSGYRLILGPGDTLAVNYTDEEQIIDFPFTYNDNATDIFSGIGVAGGFPVTMDGSISYTADGYGTLTLPNASYNNVIRYRMDRTEVTYFNSTPTGTIVKDQWVWVSSDYRYWLLLMELVDDGFGVDDNVWYQSSPLPALTTGIDETSSEELLIFPNPISSKTILQLSRMLSNDETIQLFDSQGRLLKEVSTGNQVGLNGVPRGIYLVRTNHSNGNAATTQKLIVQ